MLNKNIFEFGFKLYSTCIPNSGYSRSCIIDINRHQLFLIPNYLCKIISQQRSTQIKTIKNIKIIEQIDIFNEYYKFLVDNELLVQLPHEDFKHFPNLELNWDFPSICSNSIIDISLKSEFDIFLTLRKLEKIKCFHLQIRFSDIRNITTFENILECVNSSSIKSFQIVINNYLELSESYYVDLTQKYWKLTRVEVFSSVYEKVIPIYYSICLVIFYSRKFIQEECGKIDSNFFTITMGHYTESQKHNTCLNRKLCIDQNGYVKNCPSMTQHFGHISDCNLEEVIHSQEFQKLWFINKDQIDVCQDCEFRFICPDCRCFIQDENDIYSQPAKCKYNPYICKWEGEEGYISVSEWRIQNPKWNKRRKK
jgi:SPASM domain peptide maturase of grasp-with-spasm system